VAFGIGNVTSITQEGLMNLTNVTGMADFAININHDVFGGLLYFILLWVLWVILYSVLQQVNDQPFSNIIYGGIFVSVLSFFLRAITLTQDGVVRGLLSDFQMYVFPLLTIILGVILYSTKE